MFAHPSGGRTWIKQGWTRVRFDPAAGFALATVVFSMIFKRMPRVKLRWTDVLLAARLTLLLLTVGHLLTGLYNGNSGVSGFGAAASLILVVVQIYGSAQLYLPGALSARVSARPSGSLAKRAEYSGDIQTPDAPARPIGV